MGFTDITVDKFNFLKLGEVQGIKQNVQESNK